MAFKHADLVEETSTTTGTGTYTVDGAASGRQTFVAGISANNYCTYSVKDSASGNWELNIGQVLSGPARVTRDKLLASSTGAAINWGAGTRTLREVLPAAFGAPRMTSKSVAGGAGTTVLTQDEQRCDILEFTGALTGARVIEVDATVWNWSAVYNNTTGAFPLTLKVTGQTGIAVSQGKRLAAYCDGTDVRVSQNDDIKLATEQASTSGTSIDFTGIPAGTRRITIMFKAVSTNGVSNLALQLGDSGGVEATGYVVVAVALQNATGVATSGGTTSHTLSGPVVAAETTSGVIVLSLEDAADFTWAINSVLRHGSDRVFVSAGHKSLSAELDRVRVTTSGGTDTFDAGEINISFEG